MGLDGLDGLGHGAQNALEGCAVAGAQHPEQGALLRDHKSRGLYSDSKGYVKFRASGWGVVF